MQIIHFKKLSVPVSTGTSKVDKLLKCSEIQFRRCNFSKFPGGSVNFACLCASHTMSVNMLTRLTSTMMTGLVVPPPLLKSLDPPLVSVGKSHATGATDDKSF